MPLIITVGLLNGKTWHCRLNGNALVRDLKILLSQHLGVKRSWVHLATESSQLLQEDVGLIELVDFALADVLEPRVVRHVELELTLAAVVSAPPCEVCAAPSHRKCSRCRRARYCSRECHLQDWAQHKGRCRPQ